MISLQSAQRMMEALDLQAYRPVYISISDKVWSCEDPGERPLPLDRGGMQVDLGDGPSKIAAALIAIHGSPGEDGKLQGYLDMLGVPYQTGDVLNMSITFSKFATIALLKQQEFPVASSILLHKGSPVDHKAILELGLPVFVKPDRSGSSLGVSKVKKAEELQGALDLAFQECEQVLVEAGVTGRELTCGVVRINGEVKALPVCEIRTSREFFDFEAKYHAADTEEIVPAPLPAHITRMVQERSEAIYSAFACRGMVRVDHFWTGGDDAGSLLTIELNTVPGFSKASIFPKMIEAAGLSVAGVVNGLVWGMVGAHEE